MLFGSGNDLLDIAAGSVTGTAKLGAGADTVQLGGSSTFTGALDFGGGADILSLAGTSRFSGTLANSAGLAVTVGSGSTLSVTNTGSLALSSLTTGTGSTIGVTLNGTNGAHTLYEVSGAASFGANTLIDINVLNVAGAEGTYTIVDAGTLTGADNLSSASASLPFVFEGSLTNSPAAGTVSLVVRRKTADELDLNTSEASALGAVLAAVDSDAPIAGVLLDIEDSERFAICFSRCFPNIAGARSKARPKGHGWCGACLPTSLCCRTRAEWASGSNRSRGARASRLARPHPTTLAGGARQAVPKRGSARWEAWEFRSPISRARTSKGANELFSNNYELGAYWRGNIGPVRGFARATAGHISFDGTRHFSGLVDGQSVTREADGEWNGRLYTAAAGVSYEARMGRLTIRPAATIEHLKLTEKGYTETGGGSAFNLDVDKRTSDETAASGTVALGYDFIDPKPNQSWFRLEIEGGRRQIISGSLGSTTARFENGQPFTLTPEERTSGWLGGVRLSGGGSAMALSGEVNAEEQQGHASLGGRVSLQFALYNSERSGRPPRRPD